MHDPKQAQGGPQGTRNAEDAVAGQGGASSVRKTDPAGPERQGEAGVAPTTERRTGREPPTGSNEGP